VNAKRLPFWLGALALAAAAASCAGTQVPADKITSPGEALFNGRTKEDVACYKCHNGDGTGTMRGPDLGKRVPKLSDQQIVEAINTGPGLMPEFKDKLTDDEKKQIIAWLRTRFPQAPPQ